MEEKFSNRLFVSHSLDFDISGEKLWNVVSRPNNLNHSHPFCELNKIIQWDENAHIDRLIYLNGRNYIRRFQTWEEGRGYTLIIGEDDGPQSYVVWEIEEINKNKSKLKITIYPYILSKLPNFIAYIPHIIWVRRRLVNYLDSVLRGYEYFIETGEDVPRNHFGKHKWFS
tara:strand:- start:9661 stop:10170 length:510 start_codon:yes stop_codon:yes gene_type:complete